MTKALNLIGQQFGRLTVIRRVENQNGKICWLCQCECGNTKIVTREHFRRGGTKSCGCLSHTRSNKKIIDNGYITIYMPEHLKSKKNGYVYEHILVAEEMLGRPLGKEEVVHHKDRNRTNNKPKNLIIFKTHADHGRFHTTGIMIKENDYYISPDTKNKCIDCGQEIYAKAKRCSKCNALYRRKVKRPSLEELIKDVSEFGYCGTGRKYDVSDNCIRKWIKNYQK